MPDKNINICFLIRSLDIGGAQRQLVALARGLMSRGHQVSVIVFYSGGELEGELAQHNIAIYSLGKKSRWDLFTPFYKLRKIIKQLKPDILHGYLEEANLLACGCKFFNRKLKVIYGIRVADIDYPNRGWFTNLIFQLSRVTAKYADLIIANSHRGKDFHIKLGYPSEKIIVIPNGLDPKRFKPDSTIRNKIRAGLGVDDATILLGIFAKAFRQSSL